MGLSKTILVLEDNLTELHAIARILEHAGHRVLRATSGEEALQILEADKPDLALLDHQLPGITGLEVLHRIKTNPRTSDVFGVIHSATRVSADEQAQGLKAGADGYLAKPMPVVEFLARIETFLRQKSLVDSVRRNEARFRHLITANSDAILVVDREGMIRFCNPAAERLFGRKAAELQQTPFGYTTTDGCCEVEVVSRDGGLRVAELRAVEIDWEDRPARLVTLHDVSDRKRAEEAIRASERRFRQIVETAQEGVWSLDEQFRTTFVNRRLAEMFGYSPAEMLGMPVRSFVHPEEWADHAMRAENRRLGQTECFERRFRRKDGTVLTALVSTTPILDAERRFLGSFAMVTDITERKRAEEALRDSLQTSEGIIRFMPAGILIYQYVAPDRLILIAHNAEAERLMGLPLGQWLQRDYDELWPNARSQGITARLLQVVHTGEALFTEDLHYRDHRVVGTFRIHAFRLPGDRLAVSFENVTQRIQAEQKLRDSERLYHSLVEHLPQSIFRKNTNGQITFANQLFCTLCGRPLESLLGKCDEDLFPPEVAEKYRRDDQFVLETGRTLETVESYPTSDGQTITVQMVKTPLHDALGNIAGLQGIFWDISEQKRAEEAMRSSEERFRTLVENAPDAIFVQVQGRFTYLNAAALELFGATDPAQLLGRPVLDRLHPDFRKVNQERMRLLDEERLPLPRVEERYLRLDQTPIEVEASAVPLTFASEPGALVFVRDITERKQSEEQLRQALEEKEVLLREVHHRVKNNLQAIIHLIGAKEEQVAEEPTRSFLRELQAQSRTMSLVYEQLYQSETLARVEMEPYLQELAGNVLLTFGGLRQVGVRVHAHGVVMDVETAMPTGLVVNELLSNALKHAFPLSHAVKPELEVHLGLQADEFLLRVADNGTGLPPGLNWRNANSLGLRLVNLWVTHQLGGSIDVHGPPGTEFEIRFPGREQRRRLHG